MRVKRSFFCIVLVLCVVIGFLGCGSNGDNENEDSNQVSNYIDGTWTILHPSTDCVETYTFELDMRFTITSAEEIQTGTYTFNEIVNEGQRHELNILIESDNGLPSCSGDTSDSTGVSGTLYLEFVSDTEVDVYENPTGGEALIKMILES